MQSGEAKPRVSHCVDALAFAAGQTVFHTHFHIIPRREGDKLVTFPPSSGMIDKEVANKLKEEITEKLYAVGTSNC